MTTKAITALTLAAAEVQCRCENCCLALFLLEQAPELHYSGRRWMNGSDLFRVYLTWSYERDVEALKHAPFTFRLKQLGMTGARHSNGWRWKLSALSEVIDNSNKLMQAHAAGKLVGWENAR